MNAAYYDIYDKDEKIGRIEELLNSA
jgi:hypothetical protein